MTQFNVMLDLRFLRLHLVETEQRFPTVFEEYGGFKKVTPLECSIEPRHCDTPERAQSRVSIYLPDEVLAFVVT